MLQFTLFVWALSYSVWDVFTNFLFIDATDRSKISSDQKRFFIALSLYHLSFFANTPFNAIFFAWATVFNFLECFKRKRRHFMKSVNRCKAMIMIWNLTNRFFNLFWKFCFPIHVIIRWHYNFCYIFSFRYLIIKKIL